MPLQEALLSCRLDSLNWVEAHCLPWVVRSAGHETKKPRKISCEWKGPVRSSREGSQGKGGVGLDNKWGVKNCKKCVESDFQCEKGSDLGALLEESPGPNLQKNG